MTTRTAALTTPGTATDILRCATNSGRKIIPFLGAGLSAASGFPLINELRDYLCKVRFFIEGGVFRHFLGEPIDRAQGADSPQFYPARYIDSFGWPDFNQIDADLWWFFINETELLKSSSPTNGPRRQVENFRNKDDKKKDMDSAYDEFKKKQGKRLRWGKGRWSLQSAVRQVILNDFQFHDSRMAQTICKSLWSLDLKPRIDWFRYLLDLAGGRRGLVDGLFTQLNNLREPSLAHTLLARLAIEFGWRLHLTINFNTLLETAFRREQLNPDVYEVSRETQPPDPTLVNRSELALIKLHGGSFDLRIGEPIDHSLDEPTRNHIFGCVPDDALLLVIGFSGYERRMMQLIEELVLRREQRTPSTVRVLWMHWEETEQLPATVKSLQSKLDQIGRGSEFHPAQLSDAGLFLLEAYQSLSSTLPSSVGPYPSHPKRIISPELPPLERSAQVIRTFNLFARSSLCANPPADGYDNSTCLRPGMILDSCVPSLQMSAFVQTKQEYHLIWIDLEDHHTVSGIVGEIITKMRAFDPHLPQLVLPVDDSLANDQTESGRKKRFEKSARYIGRALRRGRYILAFDSLEGFGREQTAHHGLPADFQDPNDGKRTRTWNSRIIRKEQLWDRHQDLLAFFKLMINNESLDNADYCDWYCCFALDEPTYRHFVGLPFAPGQDKKQPHVLGSIREALVEFCNLFDEEVHLDRTRFLIDVSAVQAFSPLTKPHTTLDSYRQTLRHLNAASPKAISDILSIQQYGWGPADKYIDDALLPLLDVTKRDNLRQKKRNHALGVFLVLTVFRRPRSLAAVYSVVADLFGPCLAPRGRRLNAFDKWLMNILADLQRDSASSLDTFPLIHRMDGGFYWITHCVHEWTYKLISEPVRRQCAEHGRLRWSETDWPEDDSDSKIKTHLPPGEKRLRRLMHLIVIHSRIARFYYVHAYKRSNDVTGLYEYLYHRVASLKYVTTLKRLLVTAEYSLKKRDDVRQRLEALAHEWCVRDGLIHKSAAPPLSISRAGSIRIESALDVAFGNYLQRIQNVLTREEDAIVSRGIADTWLSWIDILRIEFQRLEVDWKSAVSRYAGQSAGSVSFQSEIGETRWTLDMLGMRLLREKGARRRTFDHVFGMLLAAGEKCLAHIFDEPRLDSLSNQDRDQAVSVFKSWRELGRKNVAKRGVGEAIPRDAVEDGATMKRMQDLVDCVGTVVNAGWVALIVKEGRPDAARLISRFFRCYRECCACLRHYVEPKGKTIEWLTEGERWMAEVRRLSSTVGGAL